MVTHQLQVRRRTGKVRRPETDVLPLCSSTCSSSIVVVVVVVVVAVAAAARVVVVVVVRAVVVVMLVIVNAVTQVVTAVQHGVCGTDGGTVYQ